MANEYFSFSGFANITPIHAGTSELGFRYDLGTEGIFDEWSYKTASNVGIQLNGKISDELEWITQAVVADRINNSVNKSITLGFLRYEITPAITARLGRIAFPTYLLSDYRNVGFAYLWTKPINDFYFAVPSTFIDGGDITFKQSLFDGHWDLMLFGGQSYVTTSSGGNAAEIKLKPSIGLKTTYQMEHWLFSAAASIAKVHKGSPGTELIDALNNPLFSVAWPQSQQIANEFELEKTDVGYYSAGFSYDGTKWLFQGELSYTDMDWPLFPDLAAGYLSIGRNIGSFIPYGFISKSKSVGALYQLSPPPSLTNPLLNGFYQTLNNTIESSKVNSETIGLGMRYNIRSDIAIKGQVERTWLKDKQIGNLLPRDFGISMAPPGYIDSISFSVSVVF